MKLSSSVQFSETSTKTEIYVAVDET